MIIHIGNPYKLFSSPAAFYFVLTSQTIWKKKINDTVEIFGQVNLTDFEGYIPHIIVLNKRRVHPFREYNITKYNTKLWDQHMNFQLKIAF